jgi:hypothetical protein
LLLLLLHLLLLLLLLLSNQRSQVAGSSFGWSTRESGLVASDPDLPKGVAPTSINDITVQAHLYGRFDVIEGDKSLTALIK